MLRHSILLMSAILMLLSFAPSSGNNSARVKFLIGKVRIQHKSQTAWQRAKMNQSIYSGDRIKTYLNSRIELRMPDGTVVKVNENTVFDVTEIKTAAADKEDKMRFTLWAGNIWAKFTKLVSSRQSRQIESPSAVVAIRGTILDMNVDANQRTRIHVIEGRVAVRSKGVAGEVMVGANQESTVDKGKAPTPPKPASKTHGSTDDKTSGTLKFKINPGKLQYTDPAVLTSGIPVSGRVTPGSRVSANGVPLNVRPDGHFEGRVRVTEGINQIRFLAQRNTEESSKTLRVLVNTRRPELRLSTPLVSGFINRRDYSLSGAVFDGTPRDKVKVFINKELITEVPGQGSFNRTIILNEGKNIITVQAVDFSKNSTEMTQQLFLDTVKPILTITEPAQPVYFRLEPPRPPGDDYAVQNQRFTQIIRGLVIDPAPSSGIKRIMVNGKEIQPRSDGSFETEIVVKRNPAENRLSFYVEDMAGNIVRDNSRMIIVR